MPKFMQAIAQSASDVPVLAQAIPPPTVTRVRELIAAEGGTARREGRLRSANPCCAKSNYALAWSEGWDGD
jgi:hypothetical protein